ncbi:ATP-dependent zinc metalloprotease FtsH [Treponema brennaborense]|uniref:ATP-dependent zinc metalloprotease FtsH n=1 Tax=Treponema brennaborense (strain DSM 12168 / CIP 105900 / DD5/3) TaxID=906968 RepID=F4LQI1_TREBD|nr:ATP-dependent zinc metalloprotease FtsH [Treponema brennaborense]AEE17190.1 ATP-dependent metalloprotease FtsH [Treponema brennaborense DSM 12168]
MNNKISPQPVKKGNFGFMFFVVVLIGAGIFFILNGQNARFPEISYSEFLAEIKNGSVTEVKITDERIIEGVARSSNFSQGASKSYFKTVIPYGDTQLMPLLAEHNVVVVGAESSTGFFRAILDFLPIIIMVFFFIFIFRQNASQSAKGMQFGRSRARVYSGGKKITFADVAGQEEAKNELSDVIDFLKNPQKYLDMGAKIPTGILLVGNPGTGKTLLARAVAGEAGVAFLHISGSDFVEMFVGVGASRVRDLFEQGRRMAPAIIFIDEIDAVGRARGAGLGGGHDEREQTLNQMLVEMDGFESKDGVIILAATNRPDVLDPALLRPGRFDRQVTVSLPDIKEREAILGVHAAKIPLGDDVDLKRVARSTPGMSGADLASLVNEAVLFAAGKNQRNVTSVEFEEARDKLLMGVARKSMVLPETEKRMTACHEAGHALPYYYLEHVSPLHKVSIIPRGRALGVTVGIPEEDSYSHTGSWLHDQLVVLYGGYAAEKLTYGDTTTGTQNDIERATELARKMVCEWGMSPDIGAISYGQEEEPIFMGRDIARHKSYSEETSCKIDAAVARILDTAYRNAYDLLEAHRDQLTALTDALVDRETMDDADIRALLGFEPRPAKA